MSLKQYHDREEEKLMKEWMKKNKMLVIDGAKQKRVKMNKSL